MFENISISLSGIWSHKMRSLLTMLGIIIGIASIITIVSTIKGTNEQIKENLIGAGNNIVTVKLKRGGSDIEFDYESAPSGVSVISEETRDELVKLDGVSNVSLFHQRNYSNEVYFKNIAYTGPLCGVDMNYFSVADYRIAAGRSFLESDYDNFRKVAILDCTTATKLFQGEEPLGKTLEIKGEPFVVVGLVSQAQKNEPEISSAEDLSLVTSGQSGAIFVPDSCWQIIYRYDEPQAIAVKASSTDDMTKAGRNVAEAVNAAHVSQSKAKYEAEDLLKQANDMQELANSTNRQLIWIAGISLLVGGIGVMNIMMVSVTERTREIGLKKAIGARRRRILNQFLTEAAVLCAIGGLLGVGAGIGFAKMLSAVMETPTAVSIPACVIAVAFSTVIGIVFGLVPAIKASKLNPIEALNRE